MLVWPGKCGDAEIETVLKRVFANLSAFSYLFLRPKSVVDIGISISIDWMNLPVNPCQDRGYASVGVGTLAYVIAENVR